MKKFVCSVCGYTYIGSSAPEICPVCHSSTDKFVENNNDNQKKYASEHILGIAKENSCPEEILKSLQAEFNGECTEVGMYLAMSRQAIKEGYPEIGEFFKNVAFDEADHAAKFAELLGNLLSTSTENNLQMRANAEYSACSCKTDIAKKAKALDLDAIHDSVHEMARDEARHGKGFEGLLTRYFTKK